MSFLFSGRRLPRLLPVLTLGTVLLAGCGGGGGGNNNNGTPVIGPGTGTGNGGIPVSGNASVVGRVTDAQGGSVVGATVSADTGGQIAITLSQGGYRLDGISGNVVHKINAAVTLNNIVYTGATQVLPQSNLVVSNANITLSPSTSQASVSGTVRDKNGAAVPGARVFLSPSNAGSASATGSYSSLIAYTDSNGFYSITNIPVTSASAGAILVTASVERAVNKTASLSSLQAGGGYNADFTLDTAANQAVTAPALVAVTSATEPTSALGANVLGANVLGANALQARAASASSGSVYEALRRQFSPAYALMARSGRVASGKRLQAHALGQYAVQVDVAFDPQPGGSVLSYGVYRAAGTVTPVQSSNDTYLYDTLTDPLANYFTDLTFSGEAINSSGQGPYTPGVQYNFALSAINTNGTESGLSSVFSLVPLGPLNISLPQTGQPSPNPVTITWNPVSGAARYFVFVYEQFPSINSTPVATSPLSGAAVLPAGSVSYTLPGSLQGGGRSYYAVVFAAADQNESLDPTTRQTLTVPNAVMTFSPDRPVRHTIEQRATLTKCRVSAIIRCGGGIAKGASLMTAMSVSPNVLAAPRPPRRRRRRRVPSRQADQAGNRSADPCQFRESRAGKWPTRCLSASARWISTWLMFMTNCMSTTGYKR